MATRPSFPDINSVFDIFDTVAYYLEFGNIPNGNVDNTFSFKVATCEHFDQSNEAYQAGMAGHIVRFRGKRDFARQMTTEIYEDMNFNTMRQLTSWHEYIVGTDSGTSGGYKKGSGGYSISPALWLFDTTGKAIATVRYDNMFLQNIGAINMSGESSAAGRINCTFSYDRAYNQLLVRR